MLVREIMSTTVVSVRPDTSIKEAARRLSANRITSMPVVDGRGHLVGVVSEADVIRDTLPRDPRAHDLPVALTSEPYAVRVGDVMSHFPLTVRIDTDVAEAAELMTGTEVKSLPVVEDGAVVGVVSRGDIVERLARSDGLIEAEIDERLRESGVECLVGVEDGVVVLDGPEDAHQRELARVLVGTVPGVLAIRFR